MRNRSAILAALLLVCGSAQAITLFSDDFEADTAKLNQFSFVNGWVVTDGSVDVVNNFGGLTGKTVDLDGSTVDAGLFSRDLTLQGGTSYALSFDIFGSRRGSTETVTVTFGNASQTFSIASSDTSSGLLNFTPSAGGIYAMTFANAGGDNVGALLDNVAVTFAETPPVPEPATSAMLLAGVAAMAGAFARRRRAPG